MSIFIGTIYVIYESGEINSKLFFYGVYFTLTFLSGEILIIGLDGIIFP